MAFWSRIGQSKLRQLSYQSKTIPYAALINPTASHSKACVLEIPRLTIDLLISAVKSGSLLLPSRCLMVWNYFYKVYGANTCIRRKQMVFRPKLTICEAKPEKMKE
ncbi:hypothetical protein ACFX1Q_004261 [Malus domestica]